MKASAGHLLGSMLLAGLLLAAAANAETGQQIAFTEFQVTSTADAGPGTLRSALEEARDSGTAYRIHFGDSRGLFSTPQTIELNSPLPEINGQVVIDGRIDQLLWKAYGVTISGQDRQRIFRVEPGASLHLNGITLTGGHDSDGGAIFNQGDLIVEGVSLLGNHARNRGGAIVNQGGNTYLVNSTIANSSARQGGAVASLEGKLTVTNSTLYANRANSGGGIYSEDRLSLANSIVWGESDSQCINKGTLIHSTHNLFIADGEGCGNPIIQEDPRLGRLDYYNGPTPVFAVNGDSPVINLGSNEAAVDPQGRRLVWDQRGNGDPRFASGYTDIGAFERQGRLPKVYLVDTLEDNGLRACTPVRTANCPLKAAMELAVSGRKRVPISFSPEVFSSPQVLHLLELPAGTEGQHLVFDGTGAAPISIVIPGPSQPWEGINGITLKFGATNTAGR